MEIVIGIIGTGAVLAAWDAARRHIAARRYNQELIDALQEQQRELERQGQQIQAVMGKLNTTTAATATRMPRIAGAR